MICPYCKKEMKPGSISAYNRLSWTPEGERAQGGTKWAKSPNGIVLAEWFVLAAATVDAEYCEFCNKIIIDLDE